MGQKHIVSITFFEELEGNNKPFPLNYFVVQELR